MLDISDFNVLSNILNLSFAFEFGIILWTSRLLVIVETKRICDSSFQNRFQGISEIIVHRSAGSGVKKRPPSAGGHP